MYYNTKLKMDVIAKKNRAATKRYQLKFGTIGIIFNIFEDYTFCVDYFCTDFLYFLSINV